MDVDCRRCGKRKHSFWTDPVGDLIFYTFKSRPWADRIVAIAQNAKAFELFVLNRLVGVKPLHEQLIMNGQKIMCLKVQNHVTGQSYLSSHATEKVARGFRSHGPEVVVPLPVQHYGEHEPCMSRARCLVLRHRSDALVCNERLSVVVRDRREESRDRQTASARKLRPGPCDGAARNVPHVPQTLSANRECRSVSRKHDDHFGL